MDDGTGPVIDDETLSHLERLSRLEVPAAERDGLKADLAAVLAFVAQLKELPDGAVEPDDPSGGTRADAIRPGLQRDESLAVAPAKRDGFFEVPRTVDEA